MNAQYKQIGNAVPVNLGYHVGRCLVAMLDGRPDLETMEEIKPCEHLLPPEQKSLFS